jgi:hypothetical protein
MLILTYVRRLVAIHKYTSFKKAMEPQIPIMSLLKKWMPYDRLAFIDEKWEEVAHCIPRGRVV